MTSLDPIGFGIVAVIGLALGRKALDAGLDVYRFLTAARPGDATRGEVVAVRGAVEAGDEDASAPVTGTSCVGYVAVLEQRYRSRILRRWHDDYVSGNLPPFSVSGTGDEAVTVDLRTLVARDESSSTLLDVAPPGGFEAPIQLAADARTDVFERDEDLLEEFEAFRNVRGNYPVRVREHRVNEDEEVVVAGRLDGTDAGPPTIDADGLLVIADDPGQAFRSLLTAVVAWTAASLLFLGPAGLWVYVALAT